MGLMLASLFPLLLLVTGAYGVWHSAIAEAFTAREVKTGTREIPLPPEVVSPRSTFYSKFWVCDCSLGRAYSSVEIKLTHFDCRTIRPLHGSMSPLIQH